MRKYVEALKKCLEELEKEGIKIGEDVEHAHIYEQNNSIFIFFHLYDNFLNFWIEEGKILENWKKIRRRNVLFEVKERIKKRIIFLRKKDAKEGKYAVSGEELGFKEKFYVDIDELRNVDLRAKFRKFKYKGKIWMVFYEPP